MSIKRFFNILIFILIFSAIKVSALNKAVIDISKMDIATINQALNLKLITSEELVNLYLDRINEYDKNYNSIITINDQALEQAKALDTERQEGKIRSPLHGIPILVKDNIDVVGLPTTAGAKALKDNYPKQNAFVIQKLIDAGAIVIAKTNMSEFAFSASSSYSSYGTVKNAYNTSYTSYGSSGGSAVALAANFAAAALGTDTNSSVRLPASAANIVGLRPSIGLLSRTGVLPYDVERDTVGPLTKTVADSVLMMNIINGYDEKDNKSINQEAVKYNPTMTDLNGIVIGIPEEFLNGSNNNTYPENKATYTEIKQLMETAIEKLTSAGAKIVYIDNYYNSQTDGWFNATLSGYTFCDGFNEYIKGTLGKIRSFKDLTLASNKVTGLDGYYNSCNSSKNMDSKNAIKTKYQNYIQDIMDKDNIDVIVYPATKNKLLKTESTDRAYNLSAHASSTINYPAITLPLGFDKENLPYGIEFMAPTNNEELLYNIATVYENLNGNKITPEIAPSLYEISGDVNLLVENYTKIYNEKKPSKFEKQWLTDVQNFYRNYSENENPDDDAYDLNNQYDNNIAQQKLIKNIIQIIKWFFIIIISLIILLLIRKKIRRTIRKIKRRRRK